MHKLGNDTRRPPVSTAARVLVVIITAAALITSAAVLSAAAPLVGSGSSSASASVAYSLSWTQRTSMPTLLPASSAVVAESGKIYAFGGYVHPNYVSTVVEYDPVADAWATRTSMPVAKAGPGVVAASNGKIYVIGGSSVGTFVGTVQEYDPLADTWAIRAPMPTPRYGMATVAALDGKIYAIGGVSGSYSVTAAVERYDPLTDTWITRTPMPTPRGDVGGALGANGKIYVVGGTSNNITALPTVEEYDPLADTWALRAPMPTARWALGVVTASNGRIYALGGQDASTGCCTHFAAVEEYDALADTWAAQTSLPLALAGPAVAAIGTGEIYTFGGSPGSGPVNDVYRGVLTASPIPSPSPSLSPSPSPSAPPPTLSGRVYVANADSNSVSVIDIATNAVIATIPVGVSPRGVSFSPDGTRAYISNFTVCCAIGDGTVSVIDTATNAVIATVPAGPNPYYSVVNRAGTRLYVANIFSTTITVIDTTTNTPLRTIIVGQSPERLVLNPDGTRLYVTLYNANALAIIDTSTDTLIDTVPNVGSGPVGLAIAPDGARLYIANDGNSTVSVFDLATRAVVATISVTNGAWQAVTNPTGTRLYVVNHNCCSSTENGSITVIDTATNAIVTIVTVGPVPNDVAITPDGNLLYVPNDGGPVTPASNTVSVVATATNTLIATVTVGVQPIAAAVLPTGNPSPSPSPSPSPIPSVTVTIRADDQSRAYGTTEPVFTFTVAGLVGADTLATPPTCTGAAGPTSPVGTYAITCAGAVARPNYTIGGYQPGTLTITTAPLTVNANDATKIYGQPNPALTGTLGGVRNGDDITATYGTMAVASSPIGSYPIAPTLADPGNKLGNYTVTSSDGSLTVTQAALTVTADDKTRIYGDPNPVLTATALGLVSGDTLAVIGIACSSAATSASAVGTYDITCAGTPANYAVTFVNGTLTVTKAQTALTIISGANLALDAQGQVMVTARLTWHGGTDPLAGKVVSFSAGGVSASGTTDANGVAVATLALPSEQYTLAASFGGDANLLPSQAAAQTVIAYQATQFVIWGGNTGGLVTGQSCQFWGPQWARQVTSGDYWDNSSFKGYADILSVDGERWTASPGGSGNPPTTVGRYIAVIVATHASKNGSTISGNVAQMVVLRVNAPQSYQPNPGHAGTGVLVATLP